MAKKTLTSASIFISWASESGSLNVTHISGSPELTDGLPGLRLSDCPGISGATSFGIKTYVRTCVSAAEAPTYRQSVLDYAPGSTVAEDYRATWRL